ncbi:MAG: 2'-5' RNA ligase family protein, partial [Bacteroidota bacterium]
FSSPVDPFRICIKGYDHFGDRVIFLTPERNDALHALQKKLARTLKTELNLFNADYKDRPFHPHMTIAFRDLKKRLFSDAYQYFKKREVAFSFEVSDFALLRHEGKKWEDYKRFSFQSID